MRFNILRLLGVLVVIAALLPAGITSAKEIPAYELGGSELKLFGPSTHRWVDKDSQFALKLAPARYKNVIQHVICLYAPPSSNTIFKPYNNYGGVFYVGSRHKDWTEEEFAHLKSMLLVHGQERAEEDVLKAQAYLQEFLREGVGFDLPNRKKQKYYDRLQKTTVLQEDARSIILSLRHKESGKKDKYIVMSLALLRGKLIGTVYYQVDPGKKDRLRADELTTAWQKALISANS
ncbi:hypothetical protein LJC48_03310 [Desulfovibrio sp. OttesenSCG-928-C06]|nr:hypothetical protein [Desulfovibrio sp. OttesenSCG-928-C06]